MEAVTTIRANGLIGFLGRGAAQRELECLLAVASGHTSKEVATQLGVAPDTVNKRLLALTTKMGVTRRAALVSEAFRRGLIGHSLALLLAVGGAFGADPMAKVRRSGGSESKIETRIASKRHEIALAA